MSYFMQLTVRRRPAQIQTVIQCTWAEQSHVVRSILFKPSSSSDLFRRSIHDKLFNDSTQFDQQPIHRLITEDNFVKCIERMSGKTKLFQARNFSHKLKLQDLPINDERDPTIRANKKYRHELSQAAVLIPFCVNEQAKASLLFTLRSATMTLHKYEVCFPGGKLCPNQDKNDLVATAVRETVEEIGISDKSIKIHGKLPGFPTKRYDENTKNQIVHPVLATIDLESSDDLAKAFPHKNLNEVEQVILAPLDHLLDSKNWFHTHWKEGYSTPVYKDELFDDRVRPKIWGLTAFFLHQILQNLAPDHFKVPYPAIHRYF